jgi:class 3 adenylate cyclase/tetratricopeptide (TPR) repeat protein
MQTSIESLEQAIAHIEAQRATLGDAVVDASAAVLRERLAALKESRTAGQQRKMVTVLFAAIAGFTPADESPDTEETTLLLNDLWNQLDRVIVEHGGRIDKHMGSGVMALWGVAAAREDDPERAVHAALELQRELGDCTAEWNTPPLRMRVGINTGPVLLGEVGITGEYTAIGDTVNLAKRLEETASAGSILISRDTYRHVRGVFDVAALAPVTVKGKAEPVQPYRVERAKPRAFRKGTRGVEGVETRMIGRADEMAYLQEAYAAAAAGRGRLVTILGEAGVGKSRLLYEFEDWLELRPEEILHFRGRANPEIQSRPYALLRDLISFRFEIQDSDSPETVRVKLEQGVHGLLGANDTAPAYAHMRAHFIGQMLGFDLSNSPYLYPVLGDARQIYDRALLYLREVIEAAAATTPLVVFAEDIHWSDDSSLNVIEYLAQVLTQHPVLILCLARPTLLERRPGWAFPTLNLQPLSREDSGALVEEILQKAAQVPEALRELIISGAEGNPFYVEELIKMLIEDGVIVAAGERWHVEPARLTAVRVPPTLTGVLQARLDSLLPEERIVLQQASVVGRIFWDRAVAYLGQNTDVETAGRTDQLLSAAKLPATLAALQDKEMVFPRTASAFADTEEFVFKHVILREVTYESVLRRVRRLYHGLVADWLIEQGGARAQEYTGLIADHLEQAGQTDRATGYLRQAGEQAARQFAHTEALSYFARALDLLPQTAYADRYATLLARARVYEVQGNREAQARDLAALHTLVNHIG